LLVGPGNASISANGVISWTPTEAQGPSTNTLTTVVTDDGVPPLSATNSFTVVVTEVNSAPVLPVQTNYTIAELTALTVTNTATDSDLPPNNLTYLLVGPGNASISTNGVITWTPTHSQAPSTNIFTTVVTDNGIPAFSATNSFTVFVPQPPLPFITSITAKNGSARITWNSVAGQTYKLQFKNLITETNWHDVSPLVFATSSSTTVTNIFGDSPQRFYRVAIAQPDLVITSLKVSNGTAVVTWDSIPGRTYRLQYKTGMNITNWFDVSPDVTAAGLSTTATDAASNSSQRFYRVRLLP